MSTQALAPTAGVSAGELAVAQRVQQLQAMIEQTRQSAAGGFAPATPANGSAAAPPSADFASALQAATASGAAPAAYLGTAATTGGTSQYDGLIEQAAARNGVDPAVLHGLIQQESGFDPNAHSSAGASGPHPADARHRLIARRRQPARPRRSDRRRRALPQHR